MEYREYLKFVPERFVSDPFLEPVSTWWAWRGRRVHVARTIDPHAPVRVLAIHGGGGHAGLLWPLAAQAGPGGAEVLAIDLPLYGDTVEPRPRSVRYGDWVELLCEFAREQAASDPRPLVVFGASMGGMLAYEVAARTGVVAHVVATCLLDPADPAARRAAARWSFTGRFAPTLLGAVEPVLGGVRVPIRWLVDMRNMSLDPALTRLCAHDPRGGGVRVPLGFLSSFLRYRHTAPELFTKTPVTLVHPAEDRWTPPELSVRFLEKLTVPTELVLLDGCGHFPVEEPGIDQLADALRGVLAAVRSTASGSTRAMD